MKTDARRHGPATGGVRVAGIRLRFHATWFVVFAVTAVTVALGHLRGAVPGFPVWAYLAVGAVVSVVFAVSLVLHELAHSLVAIRAGVPVPEITLHLLGGLSRVQTEAESPRDDIVIAGAGPLCSLLFAVAFWSLAKWLPLPRPGLAWYVLAYATYINVALVLFNLLPGLPLDGGRIVRACLWWKTGSLTRGTQLAAEVGRWVAYVIMLWGGWQFFTGHQVAAAWNVMIGVFMRNAAGATVDFAFLNDALKRGPVAGVMLADVACIPLGTPLEAAIYEYWMHHGYSAFPVSENGRVVGVVALNHIRAVPRAEHPKVLVQDVMERDVENHFVGPDVSMRDALLQMQDHQLERLFVGTPDAMLGMVTDTGLRRIAQINRLLATPLARESGMSRG